MFYAYEYCRGRVTIKGQIYYFEIFLKFICKNTNNRGLFTIFVPVF